MNFTQQFINFLFLHFKKKNHACISVLYVADSSHCYIGKIAVWRSIYLVWILFIQKHTDALKQNGSASPWNNRCNLKQWLSSIHLQRYFPFHPHTYSFFRVYIHMCKLWISIVTVLWLDVYISKQLIWILILCEQKCNGK